MGRLSHRYIYHVNIPTREALLGLFDSEDKKVSFKEVIAHFQLEDQQIIGSVLSRVLAMVEDGLLKPCKRHCWMLGDRDQFVEGHVQAHRSGYGFLIPLDSQKADVFLPEFEMQKVFSGDRVLVKPRIYRGQKEGKIVQVLERKTCRLVGRVIQKEGFYFLAPEDKRIGQDVLIRSQGLMGAQLGQVVVLELDVQPERGRIPEGHVIEILGQIDDPQMEIEIAVRKFKVPHTFDEAVLNQAHCLPTEVLKRDFKGRKDLTKLPFMTIDGEDARDFDDAVYARLEQDPENGQAFWRLWVAIADVSHYVKPNSPLDKEALRRGTSVYFPRKVIPMLPEVLSNGLCSLNPHVNRCVLVCEMKIGSATEVQGQILSYEFYNAVIRSHYRATYTEVFHALEGDFDAIRQLGSQYEVVCSLYQLYQGLLKERHHRGAIDFETLETRIVCNPEGKIEKIVPSQRNDAHKLIEECMLAANVCAADFILSRRKMGLFRIHELPSADRVQILREFLATQGLSLSGGEQPHAGDYAKLLNQIRARPNYLQVQMMCLRSMQQAKYSPENKGHFGLAYDHYTHFTSPIRRYPDLTVHRVIKATLSRRRYIPELESFESPKGVSREKEVSLTWDELGIRLSNYERRADEASYDVVQWLKCFYMQDKVGEVFSGHITGITHFGVFVTLDDLYVEGLVHISELGSDYYEFDSKRQCIEGRAGGVQLGLNDPLEVRVAAVHLEARKIDFVLAGPLHKKSKKTATKKKDNPASKSVRAVLKSSIEQGRKKKRSKKNQVWAEDLLSELNQPVFSSPKIQMNQKELSRAQAQRKTGAKKSVRAPSKKEGFVGMEKAVKAKTSTSAKSEKRIKSPVIEGGERVKKHSKKKQNRSLSKHGVDAWMTQGQKKELTQRRKRK